MTSKNLLHIAAIRTAREPMFWGHRLAALRGETAPEAHAKTLGMDLEQYVTLCLCRAPRAEKRDEDIKVVADRVGCDCDVLANLLEQP